MIVDGYDLSDFFVCVRGVTDRDVAAALRASGVSPEEFNTLGGLDDPLGVLLGALMAAR